jgi:hypothetical protein
LSLLIFEVMETGHYYFEKVYSSRRGAWNSLPLLHILGVTRILAQNLIAQDKPPTCSTSLGATSLSLVVILTVTCDYSLR